MTLSKSLRKHYRKYQRNKKQNSSLEEAAKGFNLMGSLQEVTYKFDQLNEVRLTGDYQIDESWVDRKLARIEEETR